MHYIFRAFLLKHICASTQLQFTKTFTQCIQNTNNDLSFNRSAATVDEKLLKMNKS